ncbi:hypothetical protein B0H16DRAFT_1895909 [Mycena metata]|uniref:DUF6532 domain-containing protein n=1 Tax=Mycena metata TaxID=1033252 RepID=A0AAD7MLK2_9AGAR|nr:hypothetical protein B0H16DRAFT_1895909 [Mycena metata]
MASHQIDYSEDRFSANDRPLPLGRALREHDARKKHQEAGRKRVETRDRNRANQANPQPLLQQSAVAAAAANHQSPASHPPETPRPMAPVPRGGPSHTPALQRPALQAVSLNTAPTYPTLYQVPSSPALYLPTPASTRAQVPSSTAPYFPTPASTQAQANNGGLQWFAGLSDEERALILSSLDSIMFRPAATITVIKHISNYHYFRPSMTTITTAGRLDQGLDDEEPGWDQQRDDDPADREEHAPPASSLQLTMRDVQPSYPRTRKRKRVEDNEDDSEEEDNEEPSQPKKKSRSIAGLPEEHQKICDAAFDLLKIELTLRMPFPVAVGRGRNARARVDPFNELLLQAFTDAAFDLKLEDLEPTKADLDLIRSRVPQYRLALKVVAREVVPSAYELVNIEDLDDPTEAKINAVLEKNRKKVNDLLDTFIYADPKNIAPDTMFCHKSIQRVFTGYYFGSGDNNRAFYFDGETRVRLVTLALIVVAILCAIEEWSTGRWENKPFSHKNYFKAYKGTLAGLQKWMDRSEKRVADGREPTNVTVDVLERLLRVAR